MKRSYRAGGALAALCLVAWSLPASAGRTGIHGIVVELETWLDANSDLPRSADPPAIRLLPMSLAAGTYGGTGYMGGKVRAFYDDETGMVTLIAPWDPRSPEDKSVLLHELVHHRQASTYAYCEGAKELPAYRLQAAWAEEHGAEPQINWMAAVLEAGCTPRDIHPD